MINKVWFIRNGGVIKMKGTVPKKGQAHTIKIPPRHICSK